MSKLLIGFSRPSKWKLGAELIRLWQGSTPYCHVFISNYNPYTNRNLVYQASHGDVNCISLSNFVLNNVITDRFELSLSPDEHVNVIQYCHDVLGAPYGYAGLIKIVLHKLFKLNKPGDGVKSFHCSELAVRALPSIKNILKVKDADFIEPVDLYAALSSTNLARKL